MNSEIVAIYAKKLAMEFAWWTHKNGYYIYRKTWRKRNSKAKFIIQELMDKFENRNQ